MSPVIISVIGHAIESPVKHPIQIVSVGTQHVPGYTTVSVGIQHVFVISLDVAVDIQLGYITTCFWIDRICYGILPPLTIRGKYSSFTKIFGILLIDKNIVLNIKF